MKKVVGLLLACVMVLGMTVSVFANEGLIVMEEEVPETIAALGIEALSTDDLIALKKLVNKVLIDRVGVVNETIGNGTYVVGVDIRPGTYDIVCTFEQESGGGYYETYRSQTEKDNREPISSEYVDVGEIITVNLQDGMILVMSGFSGDITEQAAPSWAP